MRLGSGGGMIGILLTVVIVGVAFSTSFSALTAKSPFPTIPDHSTTTVSSTTPIRSVALETACSSDVSALSTAVSAFDALYPSDPISRETGVTPGQPGTYPLGSQASRLRSSGLVSSLPNSSGFAVTLSTTSAGAVVVYVPSSERVPPSSSSAAQSCQRL